MKRIMCAAVAAFVLVGCGKSDQAEVGSDSASLSSVSCTNETEGLVRNRSGSVMEVCRSGRWSTVDLRGEDGADGADGEDGLVISWARTCSSVVTFSAGSVEATYRFVKLASGDAMVECQVNDGYDTASATFLVHSTAPIASNGNCYIGKDINGALDGGAFAFEGVDGSEDVDFYYYDEGEADHLAGITLDSSSCVSESY